MNLKQRKLKIRRVIIPTTPGVTSALGGIVADIRNDFVRSLFTTVSEAMPSLPATYSRLQKQALDWLRQEQHHEGDHKLHPSADMRYSGQSFEIEVPLEVAWLEDGNEQSILDAFHQRHEELYAFNDTDAEVQIMNLRLVVAGAIEKPELKNLAVGNGPAKPEREIEVWFSGESRVAPLYERDKLLASQTFSGPAVIAQSDTTSCIPDGFDGMVDAKGNVVLTWASKEC